MLILVETLVGHIKEKSKHFLVPCWGLFITSLFEPQWLIDISANPISFKSFLVSILIFGIGVVSLCFTSFAAMYAEYYGQKARIPVASLIGGGILILAIAMSTYHIIEYKEGSLSNLSFVEICTLLGMFVSSINILEFAEISNKEFV